MCMTPCMGFSMEINLTKNTLSGLNTIINSVIPIEETAETIVPDSYPDAETVTASPATAFIRLKECRPGSATVSGTVRSKVHYMTAEGESGRAVEVTIPFTTTVSNPAISTDSQVAVTADIASAESRVLNSRKLLTKADVNLSVQVFNQMSEEYTCDEQNENIVIRRDTFATWMPYNIQEKSFVISDQLELPQTAKAAAEVLSATPSLKVTECKMIGNKAVFKGDADIAVVYMTPDGSIEGASFTLPFSQLIEMNEADEDDECRVILALTGFDCMVDDDLTENSRSFSCSISVVAQAVATSISEHEVVQDLYCTQSKANVEYGAVGFNTLLSREEVHRNVRAFIETAEPAGEILGVNVSFRDKNMTVEDGRNNLTSEADAFVTYLSRDNVPYTQKASIDIAAEAAAVEKGSYMTQFNITECAVSSVDNGIEVRIGVQITIDCYARNEISFVQNAELTEEPLDSMASAVLRRVREGDTLWNLAKAYGTTIDAIAALNKIENPDLIYPGQMILIA